MKLEILLVCLTIQFVSSKTIPSRGDDTFSDSQVLGLREVLDELAKHGLLRVPRRIEQPGYTSPIIPTTTNTYRLPSNPIPPRGNPFLSSQISQSRAPLSSYFIPQPQASYNLPPKQPTPSLPRNPFTSSSPQGNTPKSFSSTQNAPPRETIRVQQPQQSTITNSYVPSPTTLSRVQKDPPIVQYSGPKKYATTYEVKSDVDGVNYGHSEVREGSYTAGEYFVLQPDGRIRRVTYVVDGDKGFVPFVEYEGQATPPPPTTLYGLNQ
ncbi:unnamed protein product [Lepeophtheirus salmonis]|uniref:(salmon louse) hypothetical protein n=2 Tax=Lepeophtheirus salmonis TaxID=72036 RepID=A0A7R8D5H8_LEPSM|nr:unnamed protein product [Lepeophtheirus salmonis]CAF3035883.1 unnamed protein product [Lepeophtheirus salmonis]